MTAAIGAATPALADNSSYLSRVQEEIPYVYSKYGAEVLLNEGYKVCRMAAQGVDSNSRIDRIESDLPMSDDAASWVDVLAPNELGC